MDTRVASLILIGFCSHNMSINFHILLYIKVTYFIEENNLNDQTLVYRCCLISVKIGKRNNVINNNQNSESRVKANTRN